MEVDFCPVLCIPEVPAFMSEQRSGLRMSTVMTYTNVNGYLIPNLTYKSGEQMEQLGKYGFLRRDYLKNYRNSLYQVMLLQDSIGEQLKESRFTKSSGMIFQNYAFYPVFLELQFWEILSESGFQLICL